MEHSWNKDKTNYNVYYDFSYKGISEDYSYDIPFKSFMDAVRAYFDNQLIVLDGTNNAIWNALSDLEVLDTIFDVMEDWLKDECEEDAYEEFKEYVEYFYGDEAY